MLFLKSLMESDNIEALQLIPFAVSSLLGIPRETGPLLRLSIDAVAFSTYFPSLSWDRLRVLCTDMEML